MLAAPLMSFPFDQEDYGQSLGHLGEIWHSPAWPGPLVRRRIPGTDRHDVIAVWPYATMPRGRAEAEAALAAARADGAVTFLGLARPDEPLDAPALEAAGFTLRVFKEHFVRRPELPAPVHSPKTRANIARALREWRVSEQPFAAVQERFCIWHDALIERRQVRGLTRLPPAHFGRLAALPDFTALVAEGEAGPAAALVVAAEPDRVHFHSIAGDDEAYRGRAFYALYETAARLWGAERTLYFGGAPGGASAEGVAQFKSRFANARASATLVSAVLDPAACAALSAAHPGPPGWFPPYRGPDG